MIRDSEKAYLLSLKPDDLTFDTLVSIFGSTSSIAEGAARIKKSRFETTDEMILMPGEYFVKEKTLTTVGRFIYNKYIVERVGLQDILGYVNYPITDGALGKLEQTLSNALIEDKMTVEMWVSYIDYRDNLGMQLNSVICASFTDKTTSTPKALQDKKKKLFKQYEKELKAGDIVTAEKIEKDLMADAKKYLEGDPGMDLYASEARGNLANYKNIYLFKGATMNNQTGKYQIMLSSFIDGIQKEDLPVFADSVVSGAYPKAVGTQDSGYLAKQLLAAMQSEVLDKEGTDCGSKETIEIKLTKKLANDMKYRYIVEGSKLVCLSPDVMPNYIDKTVKMRSTMFCKGERTCNICAGKLPYILNDMYAGLETSKVATTLLRLGMKKFHIANLKSNQIDVDDMLI